MPLRLLTTRSATHAETGELLALERVLAGRLEGDRARCGALGRLAHEHGPGRRDGLQPGGGVDEVAGDHPLADRAEGHRCLAGEDAGPCLEPCRELPDRIDQLEPGANAALGVVLVGDRRAPDGHDRVADELLDRAAVAVDDVARQVEVAGSATRGPPRRRGRRRGP